MRIMVVEDEIDLQEAIAEGLRIDGYAVDTCGDGSEAYELLYVDDYDLVVLDLNLPGMDGLDVLRNIRDEKPDLKVLILSARDQVSDKVKGLDLGAHDYLAKPFDFEELEARIRALLRQKFALCTNKISCGPLQMNLIKREVSIHDANISLTKKEFSLLEYLMLNQNRVVSQEELITHVWDNQADSFSGAIRVHMATLRKKLKMVLHMDIIETKIKEGYILSNKQGDVNV